MARRAARPDPVVCRGRNSITDSDDAWPARNDPRVAGPDYRPQIGVDWNSLYPNH